MVLGLAVLAAAERTGEVEAEAVHMHLTHPIQERVHQEACHQRVVAVDRVAAAGVVAVAATVRWVEVVEDLVAQALEADGGSAFPALGGVVVDDVQDHSDPGAVQGLDQIPELVPGALRGEL